MGALNKRRKMELGDWFNAVANLVIGILLGFVAFGMVQLVARSAWSMIVVLLAFGGGLYALMMLDEKFSRWFDRLFGGASIRSAKNPKPEPPRPLMRVWSLPLGLLAGVVLARLGLDSTLLALIP